MNSNDIFHNLSCTKLKRNSISIILFIFVSFNVFSQTSGPIFIKQQLTASGVYEAPDFEFTTAYDSLNTSNANGTIRGMFMEGLPYTEALNGNDETKVFCWYGEPAGLEPGDKVPAVLLVHGGGGEAFTKWVDEWINRGYIAIALSLRGTTPDTTSWEYSGPGQTSFFSDNTNILQDQWFYHAIGSVMLANSLLRDTNFTTHVDTAHIGVTGISWGGINNTVLAGIDERLDFVVPVYGCAFLTDSPIYSNQFSNMDEIAQDFYLANWEPSLYTPYHTAPMLFVDGNKDLQFTLNIFSRTYEASSSPEKYLRIEDAMGHGHGPGRRVQEVYDFADYITGFNSGGVKPLTFTSECIDSNQLVTYEYDFDDPVNDAVLYYCTDTLEWGKFDTSFIWLTQDANLITGTNGGTAQVNVPEEAQVYYININAADESIFSSPLRYTHDAWDEADCDLASSNHEIANTTINIFPNPVTDIINIEVVGQLDFQVSLYNIEGKLIKSKSNVNQINVETISNGTYFLEIKDLKNSRKIVEKIIVKK